MVLFQWQDLPIQIAQAHNSFIVHQDSNFLDGEYTAFGRLASEESFETLDKIAAVATGTSDRPSRSRAS